MVERKKADELLDFGVEKEKNTEKAEKNDLFPSGKGAQKMHKKIRNRRSSKKLLKR